MARMAIKEAHSIKTNPRAKLFLPTRRISNEKEEKGNEYPPKKTREAMARRRTIPRR